MAFPTVTTIVEDFTTASDPLAAGNGWGTTDSFAGTTNLMKATGGQGTKNQAASSGFGNQLRTAVIGPDAEAWCKLPVKANAAQEWIGLFIGLQTIGASTTKGYALFVTAAASNDAWEIDRLTAGNNGVSIVSGTRTTAAGDYVGIGKADVAGSPVVSAYWCPAARDPTLPASWTQVLTINDTNAAKIVGTGQFAIEMQGLVGRVDDLRAGTTIVAGTAKAPPPRRVFPRALLIR